MYSAVAAFLSAMVARVQQLVLEVRIVDEGLVWQRATAPHALLCLLQTVLISASTY